jgi:N-acetylglucosamine kinase-like BadF-type ATPase
MTDDTLIALDVGQTAIKASVGRDGELGSFSLPAARLNTELLPQLAEAATEVVERAGVERAIAAFGSTGLTPADNDPDQLRALLAGSRVRKVLLAHDSVTSYLGALGWQPGVVTAAGGGIVTLAVGAKGTSRVDGWGNIMGDAGSGYWIGQQALQAVMRAYDGRGPKTALTGIVTAKYPNLEDAYIELQNDPNRVSIVASFARAIIEAAPDDAVAAKICLAAGEEMAISIKAAANNVGLEGTPSVCLIGGILRGLPVRNACIAALKRAWPDFEPVAPRGDGLAGVRALASLPLDSPLMNLVSVA